jgi:ABC-type uncharacterized transport system substrate-binding protein
LSWFRVSHAPPRRRPGRSFSILICLALAGCVASRTVETESDTASKPVPVAVEIRNIAILQSDASPAFAGVARAIAEKWKGGVTVFSLNGDAKADADVVRKLQRHNSQVVVAIGLPAAVAVRKLRASKAIFCQVFNYEDSNLLTPWMKGVNAIPPIGQQFQAWKKLDPSLRRVGMITGPGLRHLVAEARAAAAASGIEIEHVQVSSDLETLYAFKQLSPKIQALWLVPDNRVLSRNAIRDLLSLSRKQGKQVVVFSEQLLPLGGMMNFDSVYSDIADQVIVRSIQAIDTSGPEVPGPPMLALTRLNIKINSMAVKQLGLTIPAELRSAARAP